MVLFYKMDVRDFAAEKMVLDVAYPKEIIFSDAISGREEVIVVDNVDNALEAAAAKPTARIVLMADDIFAYHPDQILELFKNGVSKLATRSDIDDLVDKVSQAYSEKKNLSSYIHQEVPVIAEGRDHKLQLEGLVNNYIVGKSAEVVRTLQVIKTFSMYDEDILVHGENGAGKEICVKTLMDNLPRAKSKQIGIMNLGEVSPQLFSSDLFGHMKGAFTGADKNKDGMLFRYNGGILYMDEIGELPLETQASLLRVLQNREYRPVGSTETKTFDIQIIMATNRPLIEMVAAGTFREDLYNRVKKMIVYVPPLRSRTEDIPLLAEVFLSEINRKYPSRQKSMSKEVVDVLCHFDWPGNVRELENFVFRAHVLEPSPTISLETVLATIRNDEGMKVRQALSNSEKVKSLGEKFGLVYLTQLDVASSEQLESKGHQISI